MNDAYQVQADCPNCQVESAVFELFDPSIAEGVPVESRCRLCGREAALGEIIFGGRVFEGREDAHRALEEWSVNEDYSSIEEFCEANMGGLDLDEVCRRLLAGEKIETNFDVVAYLFPSMLGGGSGGPGNRQDRMAGAGQVQMQVELPAQPTTAIPPPMAGNVMARALAAVMLADGRIRGIELRYLATTLEEHGLPALLDVDVRLWRPADLADPEDPIQVIRAMIGLASIDRHRDGTEWRVIREFARYWRVPMAEVEAMGDEREVREAPQLAVLWRGFRSLFLREGR